MTNLRPIDDLGRANLATIHITATFSTFLGELTDAMRSEVLENAQTIDAIFSAKGLITGELRAQHIKLKTLWEYGEFKQEAIRFANTCQSIIEAKISQRNEEEQAA